MNSAEVDPWIGRDVGSYRIERLLGRGGMGRVYVGHHPTIGSRVAIKILAEDACQSPELVERFLAEARTVSALRHDHIAAVHDFLTVGDGRPAIVMELVDGRSLRDVIEGGRVDIETAIGWCTDVLAALAAAHAVGVVHRDLKPDNIMITTSGRAMLLDFGIAKLAHDAPGAPRTQTGAVIGTPQYMSPEQIQGDAIDLRSDLYSLGIVMFELFGGRLPFGGASDFELMVAHVEQEPPSLETLRPELPAAVVAVVRRALSKRRSDRFESAAAMAAALGDRGKRFQGLATPTLYASQLPAPTTNKPTVADRPRSGQQEPVPAAVRSRLPLVLVGLAVAIAAIAGGVLWSKRSQREAAKPSVVAAPADAMVTPVDPLAPARAAEAAGKTELAAARYIEAYESTQDAEILFRIGELYERIDRTADAIRYYERYRDAVPPERASAAVAKIARLQPPAAASSDAGVARASSSTTPKPTTPKPDAGVAVAVTGPVSDRCKCIATEGPSKKFVLCLKARSFCRCWNKEDGGLCPARYVACPDGKCPPGVEPRSSIGGTDSGHAEYGCPNGRTDYYTEGTDGEPCTGFSSRDLKIDITSANTAPERAGKLDCTFCAGDDAYDALNTFQTGRTGEPCKGISTFDGKSWPGLLRCP